MEEEEDPGMGVVKRRRSRRLLEARKVLETPSEARITTESAAAAWGDMLLGGGDDEPDDERSPSEPLLRAPLRGVPLSSRPPSAAPPEVQFEEALRGATRTEKARSTPPRPRDAVRSDPGRSDPGRPDPGRPDAARPVPPPSAHAPDTGPPARKAPTSAQAAETDPPPPKPSHEAPERRPIAADKGPRTPADGRVIDLPRPAEERRASRRPPEAPPAEDILATRPVGLPLPLPTTPEAPAEATLDVPAPRPIGIILIVVGLFLAAAVFTGAVLFDAMGRTDRLDRVGRALSTAGQRMLRENSALPTWLGPTPDPVAIKTLKENEIPRLVEAVAAAGYTAGVFSVGLNDDPARARLVLEARVPDAVVAWGTDGQWVHAPPATGLGAAFAGNLPSILGGFALPALVWIGYVITRRRRPTRPAR